MATPSNKHPMMEKFLDQMSEQMTGRKRTDAIKSDLCITCGKPAKEFNDSLSQREFTISGMCQQCQDGVFSGA